MNVLYWQFVKANVKGLEEAEKMCRNDGTLRR